MRHATRQHWHVFLVWFALRACALAQSSNVWDLQPPVFVTERPLSLPQSPVLLKSIIDATEQLSKWTPPTSADTWQHRRSQVKSQFQRTLGLDPLPERTPLHAKVLRTHSFAGYTVENVVFQSRPGFHVTANVYRPNPVAQGRHPAVVSPIGHFLSAGKTATDVQSRCIGLARRGFVVLAYDAIGQGERMVTGNIHHEAGYALLPLGQTIAGWMVWDSMRAVDYLQSREDVDPDRIGITGNSGGGLNSLFTAAIDERIACTVVVGFTFEFSNWIQYGGAHCTCTHLPGVFQQMDWFEIGGLIGPRPLLMIQGARDAIFPITGARQSAARVGRIYEALDQPSKLSFEALADQPHAYSRPFREVMYPWMERHLNPEAIRTEAAEGDVTPLPEKDPRLLCDPAGEFMPRTPTVVELARTRALTLVQTKNTPADDVSRAQRIERIREWVRPPDDGPSFLAPRIHRRGQSASATWELLTFNSEDGLPLPAILWTPTNVPPPVRCVVVADSKGKAAIATSGLPERLTAQGWAVLAVDLRGRGETLGRHGPTYDTNFRLVANQILSGSPLAARRAYDLLRAVEYVRTRTNITSADLTLAGFNEDALPALLAATQDTRFQRLILSGLPHSFASQMLARTPPARDRMGDAWNDPQLDGIVRNAERATDFGSVLPGILELGDIPELILDAGKHPLLLGGFSDALAGTDSAARQRFKAMVLSASNPQCDYRTGARLDVDEIAAWLRAARSK